MATSRQEGRAEGRVEGWLEGQEEGRLEGKQLILIELLTLKFGPLPEDLGDRVKALPDPEVEALVKPFLGFGAIEDLERWVEGRSG